MTRRTRMAPQHRRAQLIAEGWSMLRDRSLDQVSVGDVARGLGVSRGLVFHYFSSKQDFHVAIAEEHCRRLLAAAQPDTTIDSPALLLRHSIENFLDFVLENRGAFLGLLRGSWSTLPLITELDEQVRNQLVAWVIESARSIEPSDVDVQHLRMLIRGWLSFAEEITVVWVRSTMDTDLDTAAPTNAAMTHDDVVDLISGGLVALAELAGFAIEPIG